jgi:hypothetical protein
MCQWCKRPFETLWSLFTLKQYAGKFYHPDCFEKLRLVAVRTGGIL